MGPLSSLFPPGQRTWKSRDPDVIKLFRIVGLQRQNSELRESFRLEGSDVPCRFHFFPEHSHFFKAGKRPGPGRSGLII